MERATIPVTMGSRLLRSRGIAVLRRRYACEEHGGTHRAAEKLGVPEHKAIKSPVSQTGQPLLVLMHGGPAHRHTGYSVGGISPFATRSAMPAYAEQAMVGLARLFWRRQRIFARSLAGGSRHPRSGCPGCHIPIEPP